jgi:hypothetical protein
MNYRSASAACGIIIVVLAALLGLSFSERGRDASVETRDSDSSQAAGEILLRR